MSDVGGATFRRAAFGFGIAAVVALALWNYLVQVVVGRGAVSADASDADVVEYELNWYDYVQAFDAHHGDAATIEFDGGGSADAQNDADPDFVRGLRKWLWSGVPRGFAVGDELYVCTNAPRTVRVHQAGHTPVFGGEFEPLKRSRNPDGGLPDEPLSTFDVMLPGDYPDTFLRLTDRRGLKPTYDEWLRAGKIRREEQ
jgi:hypothetical protein